ncbi:glycosyltransferase [Cryomorpha ignava]|uniref:Glycosyltransferase n=1 Tax=Cryomorpha ignava TaxID=101383 RepID=A0A7K3WVJ8_9FLAO|nr:glycosyltransferase [Cryomorpha ignava]NEN25729.1 glycosyltransferase [Cryomorpha ignava]
MRWITYFPEIHNVHLTKDLGLLPYYMQEVLGYDAALMARFPDDEYPALDGEVKGLETISLGDKGNLFFTEKASVHYLKNHARKIDVLNLYHLSRHTLVYGNIYKKNNPKGKLYLKLDAYTTHLQKRKRYARNIIKNIALKWLEKEFFRNVDLISVESHEGLEMAQKTYPNLHDKLIYLPNGCNDRYLKTAFTKPFKKENTILSVGRPGSSDKNYELLLAAIPFLELGNWKIRIAGPVSDEFDQKWQKVLLDYPAEAAKIEFLGNFADRKKLYEEYAAAKVFFLPSRVESFGIAFVEALYFGCVLVGHKGMSAYNDLSANGEFGVYFEDNDPVSFANSLSEAIKMSDNEGVHKRIENHAAENFYWSTLAVKLDKRLRDE